MANSMQTNRKTIALALGAVTELSYLSAGADKVIETEMQGKDNGEIIYYKVTQLGNPECNDVDKDGTGTRATESPVKQVTVPVRTKDSKLMIGVNAYERQVTSFGGDEAKLRARVGQKLGKKAVAKVIGDDVKSIGNVFVVKSENDNENGFRTFQKACSFIKSHVEGTIYGFMDWQIWGDLTGKGQHAIPCALADTRFGKDLEGKWSLIDQLRVISDIEAAKAPATIIGNGITATVQGEGTDGVKISLAGTSVSIEKGDMFTVNGIFAKDVNDCITNNPYVFKAKEDISAAGDVTAKLENVTYGLEGACGWMTEEGFTSGAVKSVLEAGKTYGACIIRAEGAQAFGVMKNVACEGAKYEKSELDGITVHMNSGANIEEFKTSKRFDMLFASKLVEPRAAALVLYPLN